MYHLLLDVKKTCQQTDKFFVMQWCNFLGFNIHQLYKKAKHLCLLNQLSKISTVGWLPKCMHTCKLSLFWSPYDWNQSVAAASLIWTDSSVWPTELGCCPQKTMNDVYGMEERLHRWFDRLLCAVTELKGWPLFPPSDQVFLTTAVMSCIITKLSSPLHSTHRCVDGVGTTFWRSVNGQSRMDDNPCYKSIHSFARNR